MSIMKLCTFKYQNSIKSGLIHDKFVYPINEINNYFDLDISDSISNIIKKQETKELEEIIKTNNLIKIKNRAVSQSLVKFLPPFTDPSKIWCIGLNYLEHTNDLGETRPTEPASYMRPSSTIIGEGDSIVIPNQSNKVTAEAEIAVVIGKKCKNVNEKEAKDFIFGFMCVLDMTALDILEKNPRFLTRAKSFDTFFSLGSHIVTQNEIQNLSNIETMTMQNDKIIKRGKVNQMAFEPYWLVSFHSKVMTLEPGDIISTGSPGGVILKSGDKVAANIDGIGYLENKVIKSDT